MSVLHKFSYPFIRLFWDRNDSYGAGISDGPEYHGERKVFGHSDKCNGLPDTYIAKKKSINSLRNTLSFEETN